MGQEGAVGKSIRALGGVGEEIEIEDVVAILEEGLLTAIAPLGHMVRDTGNDDKG